MRTPRRAFVTTSVVLTPILALPAVASGDAPPGPYFNGFEDDTAGWFNNSGATITRVPSGTGGITSASGGYHARLGIDPSPDSCRFGRGTAPIYYGPYTKVGGYSSFFPTSGYSTGVDVYRDVACATARFDKRFDWSSAISTPTGSRRRDFVFNVATELTGFVISAGTDATRCGTNPATGTTPVHVIDSGWYTFKHRSPA